MAANLNEKGWEKSDFPVVCESCLGENPYVRMSKQSYGKECKVCCRPFTVFRWCPGKNLRFKSTEICNTCCKLKNLCSVCALDLDMKMPVRIRDLALGLKDPMAKQDINREYTVKMAEEAMEANEGKANAGVYGRIGAPGREALKRIAESEPYKRRMMIKERAEAGEDVDAAAAALAVPSTRPTGRDKYIKTLFVTGIPDETTDEDLKTYFGVWGDLKSAVNVAKKKSAFITFEARRSAEAALTSCRGGFTFKGNICYAHFAKPRQQGPKIVPIMKISKDKKTNNNNNETEAAGAVESVSDIPLPPGQMKIVYPSQLTSQMGSVREDLRKRGAQ